MSSPKDNSGWADRRALFQPGRAVHEPAPARRPSLPKAASPPASPSASSTSGSVASPTTAERRRSSVTGSTGMFANLHSHKRGSEDYDSRRQNWDDMKSSQGIFGKAFDSIIKK